MIRLMLRLKSSEYSRHTDNVYPWDMDMNGDKKEVNPIFKKKRERLIQIAKMMK